MAEIKIWLLNRACWVPKSLYPATSSFVQYQNYQSLSIGAIKVIIFSRVVFDNFLFNYLFIYLTKNVKIFIVFGIDTGVVSAVKDQGHCGSCWAFASTATIESHVAISTGLLFDLSVQQTAMCTPNPNHCGGFGGCEGSTAELAFDYLSTAPGLFEEYQWGYASYYGQATTCQVPGATKPVAHINGFVQLPDNNYTAVMNAIASVGPLAVNVDASTWHAYTGGVYDGCGDSSSPSDINHVVVLVGYGEDSATGQKYWLVRNSWSASWGEQGYIRLLRTDEDDARCQVDDTPQDGVACEGGPTTVKTCGTCGLIYDVSYPTNAQAF